MLQPKLIRTADELREAVATLSRFDHFVVDVETTSLSHRTNEVLWVGLGAPGYVYLVPLGHPTGPVLIPEHKEKRLPPDEERRTLKNGALSLAMKEYTVPAVYGSSGVQLRPDIAFEILKPLLTSDRRKIGANIKFDVLSMQKYLDTPIPGPFSDVTVLLHVLDENLLDYGLKDLTLSVFLGVPRNATERRKKLYPQLAKGGIADKPMDRVARYLAKDVWYTLLLDRAYRRKLRKDGLEGLLDIEMSFYECVIDMEGMGVRIDTDAIAARGETLAGEIRAISERAWDICGQEFPLSNQYKKRDFLFGPKSEGGQGLMPLSYTKKRNDPQLNAAVLEVYEDTNELARLFLEWSQKDKLYSTFITGISGALVEGRLHTGFKLHGTVTGRLSSSNPNIQQIPRGDMLRDAFVADEGCVLVVADYDQVELRCAAYLSGDEEMRRVFAQGEDVHRAAAAAMLGKDPTEITAEERSLGKTQNFGVLYGAGPQKIASLANSSIEHAEGLIELYYERFSGLAPWKRALLKAARKTSTPGSVFAPYIEIPPFGRRRRLYDLYSPVTKLKSKAERQVVNAVVQGFAAYVMKLAMIDLRQAIAGTDIKLIMTVHDELVIQAPESDTELAKKLLTECMEGVKVNGIPILGEVPLTAGAGIGRSWAEAKKNGK